MNLKAGGLGNLGDEQLIWLENDVPTNTNSGHDIHKKQPRLVIDAIREAVEGGAQRKPADAAMRLRF